ncbi:MAG: hypothetical protein Q8Q90_03180 [bacterium]|nr:hypothetical protein [bacterium]
MLDWFFNLIARRNYLLQEIARLRGERLYLQGMLSLKERFIQRLAEKYPEVNRELNDLKLPPKEIFVDSPAL